MRAVSVGFIPQLFEDREENGRRVRVHTEVELLEISLVAVTEQALELLQKTGTSKEIGLPIIDAYTRQFKTDQLTHKQYETGLESMLRYGAIHGKEATPDLISIMSGWGLTTPEQQGELRRQIMAASEVTALTDKDLIDALSQGMAREPY